MLPVLPRPVAATTVAAPPSIANWLPAPTPDSEKLYTVPSAVVTFNCDCRIPGAVGLKVTYTRQSQSVTDGETGEGNTPSCVQTGRPAHIAKLAVVVGYPEALNPLLISEPNGNSGVVVLIVKSAIPGGVENDLVVELSLSAASGIEVPVMIGGFFELKCTWIACVTGVPTAVVGKALPSGNSRIISLLSSGM